MTPESAHGGKDVVVLWRRLDLPGLEIARFGRARGGFRVDGTVIAAVEDGGMEVRYEVRCDGAWTTRSARAHVLRDGASAAVELRRDAEGRWWRNGDRAGELDGIADVDLGFTPATNTLPIRRLSLEVGGSADLEAVWVRFPSFRVEVLPQRYTRLAERRYRYESRGGAFVAEVEVDARGLVVAYGDIWRRVAGSDEAGRGGTGGGKEVRARKAPRGRRYDHIGIPTDRARDGERHLPRLGMHVSGYESSPYGVEWMRFDPDSPLPELVRTVPHVAFEVDDLEEAIRGRDVIIEPNSPAPGVRVAFIVDDGAPVEFLERSAEAPEVGEG